MDDSKVLRLVNHINAVMKAEQMALEVDDPESTCAAHHRGAISAYEHILKKIQELMYEKEK